MKELNKKELIEISGGDRITRAFFSWLGTMAAVVAEFNEADQQTGVTGHI